MAKLSDRIKSLRLSANMTQEEFGKKFGIVKSTVSLYESGKSTPNDQIKKQICDYFDTSLDYLLGNSDVKSRNDTHGFFFFFFDDSLKDTFTTRLKNVIDDKDITEEEFLNKLTFEKERGEKYLYGECEPSLEDLIEISQILDTSTDYLLGQIPKITNSEKKLLNAFVELDDDNKDILIGKSKELLKEQRYEESVAADKTFKKTGTTNMGK